MASSGARSIYEDFTAQKYHKVGDEYSPDADLRGGVEDLALLYAVGAKLAAEKSFPNWNPDSEFRAARDRSRARRKYGRIAPGVEDSAAIAPRAPGFARGLAVACCCKGRNLAAPRSGTGSRLTR